MGYEVKSEGLLPWPLTGWGDGGWGGGEGEQNIGPPGMKGLSLGYSLLLTTHPSRLYQDPAYTPNEEF